MGHLCRSLQQRSPAAADVVLLGAGASAEAGVQTAFEMTDAIIRGIQSSSAAGDCDVAEALMYVCERLRATSLTRAGSLDVEQVFSAVELLAERDRLEVAPFIEAWHNDVDRWRAREPGSIDVFEALTKRMLVELRRQIATKRKRTSYLEPLVRAAADPSRLKIATLNYDLAIEVAGAGCGVVVHTGISRWVHSGRWRWPSSGASLLKLHGSIDWVWHHDPPTVGRLPSRFIAQSPQPEYDEGDPVLVFGLRGKLRAEGPFLSALAEFESWLETSQRLVVVGYSFRDDHVNQLIRRWTFDHRSRELVVVDPSLRDEASFSPQSDFRTTLLCHLARSGTSTGPETELRVVPLGAADAIAELFDPRTLNRDRISI
jgi:hypothetical protein